MKKLNILIFLIPTLFLSLISISGCSDSNGDINGTEFGLFGLFVPDTLQDLGAQCTRIITEDGEISDAYAYIDSGGSPDNIEYINKIKSLHEKGISVIITTRWIHPTIDDYDRVPVGDDRIEQLALLARFLNDIGPHIDVYSIQNEVGGGGPGTYSDEDITGDNWDDSNAIKWFIEVAQTARQTIVSNSALSHLKIASPVPIGLRAFVKNPEFLQADDVRIYFFHAVFEFSNRYCDYMDIHLNNNSLYLMKQMIDFAKQKTHLPLITTEWSQVYTVSDLLNEPIDSSFKAEIQDMISGENISTNKDFVEYCYDNPVSEQIWNNFIATTNYDKNYMQDGYELLNREGFIYCCWALGWQYGNPPFDMRTLMANQTSNAPDAKNFLVYNDFISISKKFINN